MIAPGGARDVVAEHPIIRLDAGGERRPQVPDADRDEIVPPPWRERIGAGAAPPLILAPISISSPPYRTGPEPLRMGGP